ncbi:MAG: hypothetical protein LQ338_004497 [Usnochroma carphineum]|nr:MAG: hypothetical protein LQ338_004497 [Usnochroma carphineum]
MTARSGVFRTLRHIWQTPLRTTIRNRLLNSTAVKAKHEDGNPHTKPLPPTLKRPKDASNGKVPSKNEIALQEQVRKMMRLIPHPLTVILAQGAHSPMPSGLLVSSFNSITLSPIPYVSFNLKLPSSTYTEMEKSRTFVASAISDPKVAKDFLLDKGSDEYKEAFKQNVDPSGCILKQGKGGIWRMKCQFIKEKSVMVGDHVVVVGKVLEVRPCKTGGQSTVDDLPLIYVTGQYRVAGKVVTRTSKV